MEKEGKELIVALDVGSTRTIAMVAEVASDGSMEIIGWDRKVSHGMRDGVIVDIEAVVGTINQTIEMVQRQADCEIKNVWTTLSGGHIECKQSNGLVSIKDNEVTQTDIDRVIEMARTVPIPQGKEILHTLTQEYVLDNEGGIRAPIGMSGMRLEARVHFITGSLNATQNLIRCIRRCGLEVVDLYFQPLASAACVLTQDEQNLGVCLIDIGGGTSDFVVYKNMAVIHSGVVPIAGISITNDIAINLSTSFDEAEDLKRRFGKAIAHESDMPVEFDVTSRSERENRQRNVFELSQIIQPRVTEILQKIYLQMKAAGVEQSINCVVITGGSSLLYGLEDLAEHIFSRPTRVGVPSIEGKLSDLVRNPNCAAAVGLLMIAQQHRRYTAEYTQAHGGLSGLWHQFRDVFRRYF